MIGIVKVISTARDTLKRLKIKCLLLGGINNGKGDLRTPLQIAPFGFDSNPTNDKRGLYTTTATIGNYYVLGYVNTGCKSEPGESRIFSTSADGKLLKTYAWFKNTGIIEFNGATDNMVRYIPLNAGLQAQAVKVNTNLSAILVNLIQLNIAVNTLLPGSITTPYVITPVDININASKINEIKTNS